jgi:hypothetical protein
LQYPKEKVRPRGKPKKRHGPTLAVELVQDLGGALHGRKL